MSTFTGSAIPLRSDDVAHAAVALRCDPASIQAVCRVETSGSGFLPDRRPRILFEAQVFHRLTAGRWDDAHPNISTPIWNRMLYGASGVHQYDRLAEAAALDEDAALRSASWGLFQIMGENHQRCGFLTVYHFVAAMVSGEGAQLDAFVSFVGANREMVDALQSQDWTRFARLYNGPEYAKNAYDTKLAEAFAAVTVTA